MNIKKLLYIFTLILFNANLKSSGDGSLDTTFNGTGFVIFGNSAAFQDIWIQTNSKIVVVASNGTPDFVAARYNLDGSLDTANFGSPNGFVTQPSGRAFTTIIQPDLTNAKILAAGTNNTVSEFVVVRYNSDGSLDTANFGAPNGFVITSQGKQASAIVLQTDKKIVVGGTDSTGNNFFIARYNTDGSLDTSFGGTGFILGPLGALNALAIQNDGKILAAGTSAGSGIIARYDANGTPDITFGGGTGMITFATANFLSILLQPDGKIIASGARSGNFLVARFLSNGTLDTTTFNSPNGFIATPSTTSHRALLQSDGKIVAVGITGVFPTNVRVARYLSTSGLDTTTFGSPNGFVTVPAISSSGLSGAFLQNGKIVATGAANLTTGLVAVYNNTQSLTNTTITSPTSGSTLTPGSVTFTGTAQNLSFVYLYLDGNFLAGFPTDAAGSNTWSFTANVSAGTHTVQAVSIYNAGHVNFESAPVTFSVAPPTTTLFATKSTNLLTLNALAGNVFSYNITVRNTGTTAATGVILTDSLPDGLTYLSSSISNGGSTSFLNNVITANIGTIAAGGFVTVTINVAINQCFSGSLTNISSITSSNAPTISAINNINVLIPSNLIRAIFTKYC